MKSIAYLMAFTSAFSFADCVSSDFELRLDCYRGQAKATGIVCADHEAEKQSVFKELKCYDDKYSYAAEDCKEVNDKFLRYQCYQHYVSKAECADVKDDAKAALLCIDAKKEIKTVPDHELMSKEKKWSDRVKVRDNGLLKDESNKKPASISHASDHGESFGVFKAGLVYRGNAVNKEGDNPYASLAANIDQEPTKEKKTKYIEANLGVRLDRWLPSWFAFAQATSNNLTLNTRQDRDDKRRSVGVRADSDIIMIQPLSSQYIQFVPNIGITYDYFTRETLTLPDGPYANGYAGASLVVNPYPQLGSGDIALSGQGQYYAALRTPSGVDKTNEKFWQVGLSYYFYDKDGARPKFAPSVALKRMVGTNPLDGTDAANRTVLAFEMFYN